MPEMDQIVLAWMNLGSSVLNFIGMGYMLFRFANPDNEHMAAHRFALVSFRASMCAFMLFVLLSAMNSLILLGGYMAAPDLNTYSVLRGAAFAWLMVTVCVFHAIKVKG